MEPDLREVYLGEWEGELFRQRVAEGHPIAQQMAAEERWDVIPGAEPKDAFPAASGRRSSASPPPTPTNGSPSFTHGGVIGQLLAHAAGTDRGFAFVGADNGSISHLVLHGDRGSCAASTTPPT